MDKFKWFELRLLTEMGVIKWMVRETSLHGAVQTGVREVKKEIDPDEYVVIACEEVRAT